MSENSRLSRLSRSSRNLTQDEISDEFRQYLAEKLGVDPENIYEVAEIPYHENIQVEAVALSNNTVAWGYYSHYHEDDHWGNIPGTVDFWISLVQ